MAVRPTRWTPATDPASSSRARAVAAVERSSVGAPDGVRLLVMGSLHQAAAGCLCPENTLLAGAMAAVALRPGELIVMDTQAGLEHFGRALARGFGQALGVTGPPL